MRSAAQTKAIERYIAELKEPLGLTDWEIVLRQDAPEKDDDALATIQVVYGQRRANLRLCHEFVMIPARRQRRVLVHELLHCHFDGIDKLTEGLAEALGANAAVVFELSHRLALETSLDAMATAWAEVFPLPRIPR